MNVTITLTLPASDLRRLQDFLEGPSPAAELPVVSSAPAAQDSPAISKADVLAKAKALVKAKRSAELAQLLAKYNAENLTGLAPADYPAFMADLEALNG